MESRLTGFISRILIGVVVFFNLLCAINYLAFPQLYISSYAVSPDTGIPIVRGIGVLFTMWNVPYLFALYNPFRHRLSLYEAILMQLIGITGETWILHSHLGLIEAARTMITRFIYFDSFGLLALAAAALIVLKPGIVNTSFIRKHKGEK